MTQHLILSKHILLKIINVNVLVMVEATICFLIRMAVEFWIA